MILLIDGRSGSGKSELARAAVDDWPGFLRGRPALVGPSAGMHHSALPQLVRLDDIYPGWDGLDAGSAAVPSILTTLRWRSWNWAADRAGVWNTLDPRRPIVLEGVGALSRASRPLATHAIWVELDAVTRKQRALDRDGNAYAPFWDRWAAQEERFVEREHPRSLADEILDGSSLPSTTSG